MSSKLKVLVTGGNAGIGAALCKQLATENDIHVFLGSRNKANGQACIDEIKSGFPNATITLVELDVTSQDSINAAAASLESEKPFHAVINNAGAGLAHGVGPKDILDVNIYGAKHVNDAFIPLVNPNGGRLIGTSSGLASSYVSGKFSGNDLGRLPMKEREPLKSFDVTWEQIQTILDKEAELGYGEGDQGASMCAYGLSKACLTAYYMLLAKQYPNLITATVSPGFINTKMTQGFGASLQPEQGTISLRKCTLEPLTDCKGWYFGSDGLRSPLDVMRNPGDPEYNP